MIIKNYSAWIILVVGICLLAADEILPPPVEPVDPYFNNTFPSTTPGAQGAWEVYDFAPDNVIASPLKIIETPDSNEVLILSKIGEVWRMNLESKEQQIVLDFKDRSFKLGEAGAVGIALHPRFEEGEPFDYLFVYYRTKPQPDEWSEMGFNRLSRFKYDHSSATFDLLSEEVLFQQYDRSTWHNGGGMFFGNDGYLYLGVGDEGDPRELDLNESTQRIDQGFFSGILRIDVDNDSSRSHPIRRQPIPLDDPPSGWGRTYSQGYTIPDDNPWQSSTGDHLEEFYAIGLRNPYSVFYDRKHDRIWSADVGSVKLEEINVVGKGDNCQWPYMEGDLMSDEYAEPDSLIGNEKTPVYFYTRSIGSSIICGGIYRGKQFPQLNNRLIFSDFTSNKILALQEDLEEAEVLIDNVRNFGLDLPAESGVGAVNVLDNGLVLICVISHDFFEPGNILALKNKEVVPDPPSRLSELEVFEDMNSREPAQGFIPYDVNSPLWSDRALKSRFIAIPNDGHFDHGNEKVDFNSFGFWDFPEGTVFMKHFDLPLDEVDSTVVLPLETRFIIVGEKKEVYGLTYKWNAAGTDAVLQIGRSTQDFDISSNGMSAFTQTWDYPSRSDCMTCHNTQAGSVLGVNTHQLNRDLYYPDLGFSMNQLSHLNSLGVFNKDISEPGRYIKSYDLKDNKAPLELRIRSYLDANCAFCHRSGGSVSTSDMDLRLQIPLLGQNILNYETKSLASSNDLIIKPGDHSVSELWVRDQSLEENRMPPLASNLVDQVYVDSLAKWIDEIDVTDLYTTDITITPNPVQDFVQLVVRPEWLPEYQLRIYDMTGSLVASYVIDQEFRILDLSHLSSGSYIFKAENKGQVRIKTIIIF
ncbi:MAG: PQQ-dependent sugar dehydrogenase [Saprospiraceae bacterium]|nr:PQQ-dependent sugar dehydrogenase [Saprospiraceae bacterium]